MITLRIERLWDGSACRPGEAVDLDLQVVGDALLLRVDAPFHGDPAPAAPPGATWGLWEHEVVELFLLGDGERYTEVELGPHGHHVVLVLEGRRKVTGRHVKLEYAAQVDGGRWRGAARLPLLWLPEGPLRANAYAIHGEGTERRFLAMHPVPGDAPDFHRLECFRPIDLQG
jgi:hypothetical protein